MKKILLFVLMLVSAVSYAQDQEIRLFSHRGGRLEFDENTMPAFQASFDAGYRGFEIDVRLTKDGKLVLFHDNSPYLIFYNHRTHMSRLFRRPVRYRLPL